MKEKSFRGEILAELTVRPLRSFDGLPGGPEKSQTEGQEDQREGTELGGPERPEREDQRDQREGRPRGPEREDQREGPPLAVLEYPGPSGFSSGVVLELPGSPSNYLDKKPVLIAL